MNAIKRDGFYITNLLQKNKYFILRVFQRSMKTLPMVHFQHDENLFQERLFYILRIFQELYIQ